MCVPVRKSGNIPKKIFKSGKVESKIDCDVCHKDFEFGILDDTKIEIEGVEFKELLKMYIFPVSK